MLYLGPSYLFLEFLKPNALADHSQLLLAEVTTSAHAERFPDAPNLALRGVKEGATGFLGVHRDLGIPGWQLA